MPSREEHLQKAKHNEKLAVVLQPEYKDWCVTAIFYAALHYVDMHLASEGTHPTSHDKRNPLIAKHYLLREIWSPYRKLNILSRNARYYAAPIVDADINNARTWLDAIKAFMRSKGHKLD